MPTPSTDPSTTSEETTDIRSNPSFWVFHPIGRGLGTGALCSLFTNATLFRTGFLYGAFSGATNLAVRAAVSKPIKDIANPEIKAITYVSASVLPWLTSAGIMRQLYQQNGRGLFNINPKVAAATAVAVEFLGYANSDLLSPKRGGVK